MVAGAAALVLVGAAAGIVIALSAGGGTKGATSGSQTGPGPGNTAAAEPPLTLPAAIGDFVRQPATGSNTTSGVVEASYQRAAPLTRLELTATRAVGPPAGSAVQSGDAARRTRATADLVQAAVTAVKQNVFAPGAATTPVTSGTTLYTCLTGQTTQGPIAVTACVWSAGYTVFTIAVVPGPSVQDTLAIATQTQAAVGT